MVSARPSGGSGEAYGADTDRLATFVDRGRRYRAALGAIAGRVRTARQLLQAAVGEGPAAMATPALNALLDAADASSAHADSVRLALLEVTVDGVRPILRAAVLAGRLPPPDGELRERVLAAVIDGLGPAEVGIDPAYFPASVLRHQSLRDRIAELETERAEADGLPLVWWDGDGEAAAELDRRLDRLRSRLEAMADVGIEPDGSIDRFDAIALVAESTGGAAWEGAVYADAFVRHRADGRTTGVRLGPDGARSGPTCPASPPSSTTWLSGWRPIPRSPSVSTAASARPPPPISPPSPSASPPSPIGPMGSRPCAGCRSAWPLPPVRSIRPVDRVSGSPVMTCCWHRRRPPSTTTSG